jgi:hypothetical protein
MVLPFFASLHPLEFKFEALDIFWPFFLKLNSSIVANVFVRKELAASVKR